MSRFITFDPERPLAFLEELAEHWSRVVVPFYYRDRTGEYALRCRGSGLLVRYRQKLFIASAWHVVQGMDLALGLEIVVDQKRVALGRVAAHRDKPQDLAAIYLPDEWLEERNLPPLAALSLPDPRPAHLRIDRFLALGFPSDRNRWPSLSQELRPYLQCITVEEVPEPVRARDSAVSIRAFHYDPDAATDSALEPTDGPRDLHGMSGGPLLHAFATAGEVTPLKLTVALAGVLGEFNAEQSQVLATPVHALESLLDRFATKIESVAAGFDS